MELNGARSNPRLGVELSRLCALHDELLRKALANPREPRPALAKVSPVLETVTLVLELAGKPMRTREIHAAAEYLAGEPLLWNSVKSALAAYAYDAAGNRVSKTNPLNRTWLYAYDANGNLTCTTTPSGGTISQSYDSENRPTKKTYLDSTPTVYYSYDQAGNQTEVTDGTGTTGYAYDAANQKLSAFTPKGGFLYSYDAAGNLLSRTYPNGLKTVYSYNDADEMVTAKVGKDITYYTHDANGNLVSTLHPNGVLDTRSYDATGRITTISSTDSKGKPFYSRSYTYDPVGNPLTIVATTPREHSKGWWGSVWRHDGVELARWTETYSYDARDRLVKACMTSSCHHYYAYSYDAVGNRTSLETKKATTTYSYDAADELLTASRLKLHDHHPDVTTYSYDLSGNQTRSGDRRFAYNLEDKLTEVMDKHGHVKVSYSYAEDGLMATRSEGQETTAYSWDTLSELPELAVETTSKKGFWHTDRDSRSYTYGAEPLGIIDGRDSITFHTDSLGSVVQLSDEKGKLLQSYRYSPFGGDYSSTSAVNAKADDLNSIRFTGQYLDSETELYNMRVREYDPETGRFLETDPLVCDQSCSSAYVYADDQPTALVDPSGENPANPDPPLTHQPKKIRVTFFSQGQLKAIPKRGKGATWRWEKVNSKNWHVCKWDGTSHGASGSNWVYDETGADRSAELDGYNIMSCWLSATYGGLSRRKLPGRGYVYMAPKPWPATYGWKKHNYFGVPVTRFYAELYHSGTTDPKEFLKHWRYSKGSPAVLADYPITKEQARSAVYKVCTSWKFPSPGWMSIYADSLKQHVDAITSNALQGIEKGLDQCSLGR
jgi:RHS repeat-associated protein